MTKINWNNQEEVKAYHKAYNTTYYQKNKDKIAAYYQANKDKTAAYNVVYYQANKERLLKQMAAYSKTTMGRASKLVNTYRQSDKQYNRDECTLTAQWIVDNIFSQPCHYCGESDWTKLGCDRIDNSLPHTPDNVVPCCTECNKKRGLMDYDKFMSDNMLI